MTDTGPITSTHQPTRHVVQEASTHESTGGCVSRLRRILRLNGANCLVSGTTLAVAAGPIDELLATGHPVWVRVVGLGLLPFAALCWWVASGPVERLRRWTLPIVVGDVSWVVVSASTVLLGWYSGGGIVAVLAMAVVVATFAVLQFVAWRRIDKLPAATRPTR